MTAPAIESFTPAGAAILALLLAGSLLAFTAAQSRLGALGAWCAALVSAGLFAGIIGAQDGALGLVALAPVLAIMGVAGLALAGRTAERPQPRRRRVALAAAALGAVVAGAAAIGLTDTTPAPDLSAAGAEGGSEPLLAFALLVLVAAAGVFGLIGQGERGIARGRRERRS